MVFNVWTFVFQVLNFLVLVAILHWLLYRPLRAAIDERRQASARSQEDAEIARKEAAALQQKLEGRLAELEQERRELFRKARDQAAAERAASLAETERAASRRREEVEEQLARDRADALQVLHDELVGSAVALAQRFLKEAADTTIERQLAGRLVAELNGIPDNERRRLREDWAHDEPAVIETAADLNGEILETISGALESLAGRPMDFTVQTHPALLCGIRLRIGGNVWDASLATGLEAAPKASPGRAAS
jgi:F-type H+-transporting ATPase subunit b